MKERKIRWGQAAWLSGLGLLVIVTLTGTALFVARMGHGHEV